MYTSTPTSSPPLWMGLANTPVMALAPEKPFSTARNQKLPEARPAS